MGTKPLGRKAYGSIGHLPTSRRGPGDHGVNEGQAAILTELIPKRSSKLDIIIVQEKLDGSNVAVCRIDNEIIPLVRAGYVANTSPHEVHQRFHRWVMKDPTLFSWLNEGESVSLEWLALAHGTIYEVDPTLPFAVIDLFDRRGSRVPYLQMLRRLPEWIPVAPLLHYGGPISINRALQRLGRRGQFGAKEDAEGVVYRCETGGRFNFLAKYVRPEKVDGKYLQTETGDDPVWLWGSSDD